MRPLYQAVILCQCIIKHDIQSTFVISNPDNWLLPLNSKWYFSPHICPHPVQDIIREKNMNNDISLKQPIQAKSQEDRSFPAEDQQVILNKANKKSKTTKNGRKITMRMNHNRNSLDPLASKRGSSTAKVDKINEIYNFKTHKGPTIWFSGGGGGGLVFVLEPSFFFIFCQQNARIVFFHSVTARIFFLRENKRQHF